MINLRITVIVTDPVALSLHELAPATDESKELLQSAESLGVTLEPMHPGVKDPTLLPFFTIDVPDMVTAEQVIAQLQQLPAVKGAYIKPPDEPP